MCFVVFFVYGTTDDVAWLWVIFLLHHSVGFLWRSLYLSKIEESARFLFVVDAGR